MLERIISDFTSWHWWVTVVLVGVAINLVSAYAKGPLDELLSQWSTAQMGRLRRYEAFVDLYLRELLADSRLISLRVGESIRLYLYAVVLLLLALMSAGLAVLVGSTNTIPMPLGNIAVVFLGVVGLWCLVLVIWIFDRARAINQSLARARVVIRSQAKGSANHDPSAEVSQETASK